MLLVLVPYPLQAETFLPDICQAGKSAEQRQRDAHADIFVHVILQLVFDRDDLTQVIPFRVVVTGIEAEFRLDGGRESTGRYRQRLAGGFFPQFHSPEFRQGCFGGGIDLVGFQYRKHGKFALPTGRDRQRIGIPHIQQFLQGK